MNALDEAELDHWANENYKLSTKEVLRIVFLVFLGTSPYLLACILLK